MSTKKTLNLAGVIGQVRKKNEKELQEMTQEFSIATTREVVDQEKTSEFKAKSSGGITIQARVRKVPESFKIKPSLKKMVEEIVKRFKDEGNRVSKGEVYNYLIAKGLETSK